MRLSISKVRLFKSCRRAYELKYIYGIVPVYSSDALVIGRNYHQKIEDLYNCGLVDASDMTKESAMALAYEKYIFPHFKVSEVETWKYCYVGNHILMGRLDGLSEDGCIVEHKSISTNPDEYEFDLQWDEQVLAYMAMTGMRKVYYTLCRKPTIRKTVRETDEEFFHRAVDWYETDTDQKIRLLEVYRTDEEVLDFVDELRNVADEMENPRSYYRNTSYCWKWGRRCEYAPICLHYDPNQQYVGFTEDTYVRKIPFEERK